MRCRFVFLNVTLPVYLFLSVACVAGIFFFERDVRCRFFFERDLCALKQRCSRQTVGLFFFGPGAKVVGREGVVFQKTLAGGSGHHGDGHYGGEKRKVLIVSVSLAKAMDLALRSKTQRRIEVL